MKQVTNLKIKLIEVIGQDTIDFYNQNVIFYGFTNTLLFTTVFFVKKHINEKF